MTPCRAVAGCRLMQGKGMAPSRFASLDRPCFLESIASRARGWYQISK
jgi:hypothetical protein